MRLRSFYLSVILFFATTLAAFAQNCPTNIGFEAGDFTGWSCYAGTITGGNLILNATDPIPGRHTILKNTSPQAKDPYGKFPVNCPNGSGYSLMLGNSGIGAQAERVTYSIKIPDDNKNYTLVYYYAVVFENPNHTPEQQPAFTANVYDATAKVLINGCQSHTFEASSNLQGFQKSDVGSDVVYKDWSPVTINLLGYQGKTIRLEFTTNDCTKGGHFGYAYLDINENCVSPITGNNYCNGTSFVTLTAPAGFQSYRWLSGDYTKVLGTDNTLVINPPPPDGTKYALETTPFPDLGCLDTLYTTVNKVNEDFLLKVRPTYTDCAGKGYDLTQALFVQGSSPGLKYEYYLDPAGENYISDPKYITESGTYYIRGTNSYGCTDIQPIQLTLIPAPAFTVTAPTPVCVPGTVDITDPKIVGGKDPTLIYGYYSDAAGQVPMANPKALTKSATYYIKATNSLGCSDIEAVPVIVSDLPVVVSYNVNACPPVNITTSDFLVNNTPDLSYTYFRDAALTDQITDPTTITESNTYYVKGTNVYGCYSSAQVTVTVYPIPVFTVVDPLPVVYPSTVNILSAFVPINGITYSYWKDSLTTIPLTNYTTIAASGKFFIKGENVAHCSIVKSVKVTVNPPPEADLIVANTFTPNGDGKNDLFSPEAKGVITVNYLKIYNRLGELIFNTKILFNRWDGTFNGKPEPVGTYYWVFNCYDNFRNKEVTKSGSITLIR